MNRSFFNSASGALFVVFLSATALVVSQKADPVLRLVPFLGYMAAAVLCVCIAASLLSIRYDVPLFLNLGAATGLSFCAVLAVHVTAPLDFGSVVAVHSPVLFLFYAVILLYASCGRPLLWLYTLLLLLSSLLTDSICAGFFRGYLIFPSDNWLRFLLQRSGQLAGPMVIMIVCAVLPALVVSFGRRKPVYKGPAAPAPPGAATAVLPPPDTRSVLSPGKTHLLTIESDTGMFFKSDVDDLLSSVVYFISRNFKAYSALGFVFDVGRGVFTLNSFHSRHLTVKKGLEIPLGRGVIGTIGVEKSSFMSGDIILYGQKLFYYGDKDPVNSVLAVPILSDARELLGALVVDSVDKNSFTEQHKDALRRFSDLAAALITNVRMRMYQEKAAKNFQIFYQASQQFTTALHTQEVFDVLFRMIGLLTPNSRMMVVTFNEQRKCGVISKVVGASPEVSEGMEFPINAGLYSYAFTKRTVVNIGAYQLYKGKYFRFMPDEPFNPAISSLLIVPVQDDEQRILGLLSVESETPNQFLGEAETMLSTLLGNASVAITRARLYQKMEMAATTDGLTLLNNHRTFQEQLSKEVERSRRYQRPLSLLILDIDHFKQFNDTYGHPVGDLVLKEIAACIRQSIRLNDIAARYGGEEFAVIIPESNEEGAMVIAERIRRTVEQTSVVSLDKKLTVTISIGCATMPLHAQTKEALIDCADKALYFSKDNGRNRISLYAPDMTK
jgi:diguanylate cyclase (GGDEF)-like protein